MIEEEERPMGIVLPPGVEDTRPPKDGSCLECKAPKEDFGKVLSGKIYCTKCGWMPE